MAVTAGELKEADLPGIFPAEIALPILAAGLDAGAPVLTAMTRRLINAPSLAFSTADATGFDWRTELQKLPDVTLTPGAGSVVTPGKIGGLLLVSNEALDDASFNLSAELTRLLGQGLAKKLDTDLVYGSGTAPAPTGFYAGLTKVTKANLREAVIAAAADVMTHGGRPDTLLISGALWAAEATRRETVPGGFSGLLGLDGFGLDIKVVVASTLKATDAVLLDSTRCFGVVRKDVTIAYSKETTDAWTRDGTSFRVLARVAVAIPEKDAAARAIAVGSP